MKKLFCQQNELICSDNMCYYCIVDHMVVREREINSSFANLWEPNHRPVAEFITMGETLTHTEAISHKE